MKNNILRGNSFYNIANVNTDIILTKLALTDIDYYTEVELKDYNGLYH